MKQKIAGLTVGNLGISMLNVLITTYIPLFLSLQVPGKFPVIAVVAAGFFAGIILQPVSGALSDCIRGASGSRKFMFFVFAVFCCISLELIPRAESMGGVYTAVFMLFICFHSYQIPLSAMVPDNIGRRDRDKASSFWSLMGMAGSLIVPLAAIALWNNNKRLMFDAISLIILITVTVPLIFINEEKKPAAIKSGFSLKHLLSSGAGKQIVQFYILKTCWWIASGFIIPFFPYYMNDVFGVTVVSVSLAIEVSLIIGIAASLYLAGHGQKYDKKVLLFISMIYVLLYSVISVLSNNIYLAVIAIMLYGTVLAILTAIPLSILYNIMPQGREGLFLGLDNIFLNLPQAVSIGAAGIIYTVMGIRSVFIVGIIFSAITIILLMRFRYNPN